MKAYMKRKLPGSRSFDPRAPLAVFLATFLALPASAATSFPDYPLQTGTDSIPPNILFILDDSGSMEWLAMPNDRDSLGDNIYDRSATHNTIYYDPSTEYLPWYDHDGRLSGGTSLDAVYSDLSKVGGATADLTNSTQTYYVAKPGVTDLTKTANFYRFQIRDVSNDGVDGVRVVRSTYQKSTQGNEGVKGAGCYVDGWGQGGSSWRQCELITPSGETGMDAEAVEIKNYAAWYSYHRTRMKVAKAGASEAFYSLGTKFRVGYDSIWNRLGASGVSGDRPAFPIPVGPDNDGLFEGDNREHWFETLHDADGSSTTPLHGALQRAGTYFEEEGGDGPWGPQSGTAQLSCRQNFAILTSDGYWNSSSNFSNSDIGNADGTDGDLITSADNEKTYKYDAGSDGARKYRDGFSNTLADVAMHYWKSDLRGLPNNVPTSSLNPAFWQHMVTFGISIGLQGTLDPESDVDRIASGNAFWPNPWRTSSNNEDRWDNESARRIDDLLHASVNGRGSFVAASNPSQFADALKGTLNAIKSRKASGSNVTSNGPQLNTGSRIFQATFTSIEWSGDVQSIALSTAGGIGSPVWSVVDVIEDNPSEFLARDVYTWNAGTNDGVAFPTTDQSTALARSTGAAPVTGAQNAAYIKGNRSLEVGNGGKLRPRITPLGDIVNSSPFFSEQAAALFIGANDGMLHGINSATGKVEFSYVPAGLDFGRLSTLSDPEYEHYFFVDGGIDVTTHAQGGDKNILVGSLGRGGKGVFALDVTAPSTFDAGDVLWDGTTTTDADMGYVLGAPLVRKGRNATGGAVTYAFVGNGIESENGSSTLFVYNAVTGAETKIVVDANGGGLAAPRAADTNLDGIADTIYAGDLSGSLWRFDISGNRGDWTYEKMFAAVDDAGNPQPITAPVTIAREPVSERIFVMFGTGQYISIDDVTSTTGQTMYALIDDGSDISGRADLEERTIPRTGVDSKGRAARSWEAYSPLPESSKGWFIDLGIPTAGERVVTGGVMRGSALWFASIIPQVGTGCDVDGTGYLNAIDAFTGTSPQSGDGTGTGTYMDVDGDGQGDDKLGGGEGGEDVGDDGFVGSIDLDIGMPGAPVGVGNNMYSCGSDAECREVDTPPDTSGARRLGWRELFNRN